MWTYFNINKSVSKDNKNYNSKREDLEEEDQFQRRLMVDRQGTNLPRSIHTTMDNSC